MGTDPRRVAEPFSFRETSVTLLPAIAQVVGEDQTRIGLHFQISNVDLAAPIVGIQGRVTTDQKAVTPDGFPVTFSLHQSFYFSNFGRALFVPWFGYAVSGVPRLTIIEVLYYPTQPFVETGTLVLQEIYQELRRQRR